MMICGNLSKTVSLVTAKFVRQPRRRKVYQLNNSNSKNNRSSFWWTPMGFLINPQELPYRATLDRVWAV